ncbi:MAG: permease [Treponema sp.]|nr:permease [Treponema sp.]
MVLGSLISVFAKEKILSTFSAMENRVPGLIGLIPASLAGIASPLCMFGTIPITASFASKGIREDWLAAFMMSSILLNPQLLFYSAALGRPALIIRFISSLLCGIMAGLLVHLFFKKRKFFKFAKLTNEASRDTDPNLFLRFLKNLLRNIKYTAPYFIIGISLSALFQRYVPPNALAGLFGRHRGFGLLMAATVGVPLYVCGGATIPLMISWMHSGMSLGTASAFMLAGPAMKITNLGALKIVLGMKDFIIYILFSIVFALLTGMLVDFL